MVYTNENREYMSESNGDGKLDKKMELNPSMSITRQAPDEYTRKVLNVSGGER